MRRLAGVALAAATAAAVCTAVPSAAAAPPGSEGRVATAGETVAYRPPVDAPVVDTFRPPATPHGAGNLGVDYASAPGAPVVAAAAGQVVFAGQVGGGRHVVVLHADGVRTTAAFLASVRVRRGQRVAAGEALGTSGSRLHFGARAGEAYLDPLVLLGGAFGPALVRLVPDDQRSMGSEADERGGVRRFLSAVPRAVAGAAGVGADAAGWAADGAVAVGTGAVGWARDGVVAVGTGAAATAADVQAWLAAVAPVGASPLVEAVVAVEAWWDRRGRCTPAGVAPAPPAGRRRVVLVAGLGSTSAVGAGIDGVDTAALGYDPADVQRFSYRGGATTENAYDAADTQVDIVASGARLRELLGRLAAEEPGVAIDVIAHSQGGLVARVALGSRPPPGVESLITLATPHHGADLATALDLADGTPKGAVAAEGVSLLGGIGGIDPTSTSVHQLSETSAFIRQLNAGPLPEGVRVTSIAGRADVVVPSPRTRLAGATNVVVTVDGFNEHPLVPGAPAATREMALALAGMAPTCEGLLDAMTDVAAGQAITSAGDALGLALWGLGR